ncbi:uncharacterized protein LOC135928323 [Gordionus sp. m RMFG-2023]|uniref:uncharacterized protein LOC135928323 n=1 Tax=Gordionus sp. m RMFG-2023 TaxID=3053472 RepID=UPI0031FC1D0D
MHLNSSNQCLDSILNNLFLLCNNMYNLINDIKTSIKENESQTLTKYVLNNSLNISDQNDKRACDDKVNENSTKKFKADIIEQYQLFSKILTNSIDYKNSMYNNKFNYNSVFKSILSSPNDEWISSSQKDQNQPLMSTEFQDTVKDEPMSQELHNVDLTYNLNNMPLHDTFEIIGKHDMTSRRHSTHSSPSFSSDDFCILEDGKEDIAENEFNNLMPNQLQYVNSNITPICGQLDSLKINNISKIKQSYDYKEWLHLY